MPSSEEEKANELLAKVRKEPANKVCANCSNTSRLGFGAVCTKYNTFDECRSISIPVVCDLCKSAHQSFSHRTKSVSMSVWKPDEVWPLYGSKGGGNEVARSIWFAKMTEAERAKWVPAEGSQELDKYKKLIYAVYEEGRWKGEAGASRQSTPPARSADSSSPSPVAKVQRAPPRDPEPEPSLFDPFGSQASSSVSVPTKPQTQRAASAPAAMEDDLFGDFIAQPPAAAPASNAARLKSAVSAPAVDLLSLDFSHIPAPSSASQPQPLPFHQPFRAPLTTAAPVASDPFADIFASVPAPSSQQQARAAPPPPANKQADPFAGLF